MWGRKKRKGLFSGYACSHAGCVRGKNEDSFLLDGVVNQAPSNRLLRAAGQKDWHIAGVFDGMGGGERGQEASLIAARELQQLWSRQTDLDTARIDGLIRRSFRQANNRILDLSTQSGICGTTGTVLCTDGVRYKLYHLGDSRAYLLRGGILVQLTRDQTLAQMKLELGLYGQDSPQAAEDSHKLTEYIGRDWTRENLTPVESQWETVQPGDRFLLCSDGLYDMCGSDCIQKHLRDAAGPEKAARVLTEAAIKQGGIDNVTCLVIYL